MGYEMAEMKVESDSEVSELRPNEVYEFRQTGGFLKRAATRLEIVAWSDRDPGGGDR